MLRTRNLDRESRRNISFARVSFSALARASPDGLHPTQNSIATEDLISTHALKTRTNTTTPSKHASQEEGRARCDGECSARSSGPRRCARLNAIPHRRPGTRLTMPSPTQASLSSASHASSPLSMTPSSTLPISRTSEQHTLLPPTSQLQPWLVHQAKRCMTAGGRRLWDKDMHTYGYDVHRLTWVIPVAAKRSAVLRVA